MRDDGRPLARVMAGPARVGSIPVISPLNSLRNALPSAASATADLSTREADIRLEAPEDVLTIDAGPRAGPGGWSRLSGSDGQGHYYVTRWAGLARWRIWPGLSKPKMPGVGVRHRWTPEHRWAMVGRPPARSHRSFRLGTSWTARQPGPYPGNLPEGDPLRSLLWCQISINRVDPGPGTWRVLRRRHLPSTEPVAVPARPGNHHWDAAAVADVMAEAGDRRAEADQAEKGQPVHRRPAVVREGGQNYRVFPKDLGQPVNRSHVARPTKSSPFCSLGEPFAELGRSVAQQVAPV